MTSSLLQQFADVLAKHNVDAILIGGWAAIVHGSARSTVDVDFLYSRERENLNRMVAAFKPLNPYLRDAPQGLPFVWDLRTLEAGLNFTLTTDLGPIDLLGEVPGGGCYNNLINQAQKIDLATSSVLCADLESLIQLKKAAGRPKDLEAVAELIQIMERRSKS